MIEESPSESGSGSLRLSNILNPVFNVSGERVSYHLFNDGWQHLYTVGTIVPSSTVMPNCPLPIDVAVV